MEVSATQVRPTLVQPPTRQSLGTARMAWIGWCCRTLEADDRHRQEPASTVTNREDESLLVADGVEDAIPSTKQLANFATGKIIFGGHSEWRSHRAQNAKPLAQLPLPFGRCCRRILLDTIHDIAGKIQNTQGKSKSPVATIFQSNSHQSSSVSSASFAWSRKSSSTGLFNFAGLEERGPVLAGSATMPTCCPK